MRTLTVAGAIVIVPCNLCAYQASGLQPLAVANASSVHDRYVHGVGLDPDVHAALRVKQ